MEIKSHLGGCVTSTAIGDINTYVPVVWDKLIELYNPKTLIDIGCGGGYSLKYFLDKGIDAIGIEGHEYAIYVSPVKEKIIKHDYVNSPFVPNSNIDMAWSCEFVEHVEEQYSSNFMQTFAKCKYIAMTHATENIPGISYHHMNYLSLKAKVSCFADDTCLR